MAILLLLGFVCSYPATTGVAPAGQAQDGQREGVRAVTLDNGVTMLLMRQPTMPGQVACGWMLRGGASLDPPDASGLCHMVLATLFESADAERAAGAAAGNNAGGNTGDGAADGGASPLFTPLNPVQRRIVILHDLVFWETQYPRWRGGEIGDPFALENQTAELANIRQAIGRAFDPNAPGAANAPAPPTPDSPPVDADTAAEPPVLFHVGVAHDFGLTFAQIPSANLDHWAKHEVRRLSNWPDEELFRTRQSDLLARRIELGPRSPGLAANHELDAALWRGHVYGRRAMSSIALLDDATYEQASAFYTEHMRPENLVVVIVGDINPVGAAALLRRHFEAIPSLAGEDDRQAGPESPDNTQAGLESPDQPQAGPEVSDNPQAGPESSKVRIEAPNTPPPPTTTLIERDWSLPTRVREIYRTVPIDHPDHAALLVLSRVLRDRLHALLVATDEPDETAAAGDGGRGGDVAEAGADPPNQLAVWAAAGADGRKDGGVFIVEAEAHVGPSADGLPGRPLLTAVELQTFMDQQIERLKREPIDAATVDSTRRRIMVDLLSPMNDHVSLLLTLGTYEGLGDWRRFNTLYTQVAAVTPIDAQAAARTYLRPDRRVVGRFEARSFDLASNPELAELEVDQRQAAVTLLNRMIDTGTPESWAQTVDTLENELSDAPPLQQSLMRFLIRRLRQEINKATR